MARRIYRQLASGGWFITCPYCRHSWLADGKSNFCLQCKGIFSEELIKRLAKLGRAVSSKLKEA